MKERLEFAIESSLWAKLGICGCADESAAEWAREALRLIQARSDAKFDEASNAALSAHFRYEDTPVYWSLWSWLDSTGLIEHGGNVIGSWLTDDGKRLLAFLATPVGAFATEHGFRWTMDGKLITDPKEFG